MCCFCLSVWSTCLKSSSQSYGSNSACLAEYPASQLLLVFSFFPFSLNISGGHLYLKKCSELFCTQLRLPVCDKDHSMCKPRAPTLAAAALLCCLYSSALPNLEVFILSLVFPCSVFSFVFSFGLSCSFRNTLVLCLHVDHSWILKLVVSGKQCIHEKDFLLCIWSRCI